MKIDYQLSKEKSTLFEIIKNNKTNFSKSSNELIVE